MNQLIQFLSLYFIIVSSQILVAGSELQGAKPRPEHQKLSGDLLTALDRLDGTQSRLAAESEDAWIEVDIRLRQLNGSTVESLRMAGLDPIGVYPRYSRVVGRALRQSLPTVAALEEVVTIHSNQPALNAGGFSVGNRQAGSEPCGTTTDHARHIKYIREAYRVDGNGIKIGIISDSFRSELSLFSTGSVRGQGCDRVLTGSDPQLRGELPTEVFLVDDGAHDGGDEGRAMAEIIHDLAPKAQLYFHGGGTSIPDLAEAIDRLAACRVDIIVDDLFFSGQPMFQDGLIAQAAKRAVDPAAPEWHEDPFVGETSVETDSPHVHDPTSPPIPISYLTVAGNQGSFGIAQTYRDSFPRFDETQLRHGSDLHEFAPNRRFLPIIMPSGCGVGLALQWKEPFSSPENGSNGAHTDLDLYLCEERDPSTCRIGSAAAQGCSAEPTDQPFGDPMESIRSSINTSDRDVTLYLAVDHFCGPKDIDFRIVTFAKRGCEVNLGVSSDSVGRVQFGIFGDERLTFTGPQMYGHAVASGVAAVAATPFAEIEDPKTIEPENQINVERFSARGGEIVIAFDPWGRPLEEPDKRVRPQFTAPDRSETSFFGNPLTVFGEDNPNKCREFAGTSASAPYAAAIAALLLDFDKRLEPPQIIDILSRTALPMMEQKSRSGAGLIDLKAALQRVQRLPQPPTGLQASFDSTQQRGNLRWDAVDGIESYSVEIQTLPEGKRVLRETVQATLFETPTLPAAQDYRWRVQSLDEEGGDGPWSEWVTFNKARRKLPPGFRNLPASALQRTGEEMP